jgi:hypothetical protein
MQERRESERKNKGKCNSAWWIGTGAVPENGDEAGNSKAGGGVVEAAPQWAKQFSRKRKQGSDREWKAPGLIRGLDIKKEQKEGVHMLNVKSKRPNNMKEEEESEEEGVNENDDEEVKVESTTDWHGHEQAGNGVSRPVARKGRTASAKEKEMAKQKKEEGSGTSSRIASDVFGEEGRAVRRNRGAKPGEWWVTS